MMDTGNAPVMDSLQNLEDELFTLVGQPPQKAPDLWHSQVNWKEDAEHTTLHGCQSEPPWVRGLLIKEKKSFLLVWNHLKGWVHEFPAGSDLVFEEVNFEKEKVRQLHRVEDTNESSWVRSL